MAATNERRSAGGKVRLAPMTGPGGWSARLLAALWLAAALVTIYVTVAGLPHRFAELRATSTSVSAAGAADYIDQQLHPVEAEVLAAVGLSTADYAGYIILLEIGLTVIFFVPAVLIAWQRRDEWLAMIIALALLCFGLTEPAIDSALVRVQPLWDLPLEIMQAFGLLVAFALGFLVFPDGRLTPRWTRISLVVAICLMTLWVLFPDLPYNPVNGASWERTPVQSTLFGAFLLSFGVLAQVQRYRRHASAMQRQQIKAGTVAFVMLFIAEVVRAISYAAPGGPGAASLTMHVLRYPVFILLVLFLPLGFGVAILRYRLWDFSDTVRRTLLYALLTASVAVLYILVVMVAGTTFDRLAGFSTIWPAALLALVAALLLLPAYRFLQRRIDRASNRQWIDFQAELATFGRDVRTRLNVRAIGAVLVDRAAGLMQSEGAALALVDGRSFALATAQGATPDAASVPGLLAPHAGALAQGEAVEVSGNAAVQLLVPLLGQRAERPELIGVLLCGPRKSGRAYERADRTLLAGMADQAASAIVVAELVETERRAEQRRSTPLGKAEALAAGAADPASLQAAILALFDHAVADPLAAQELAHLPAVLRSRNEPALGMLAEGCHLLVNGREEPGAVAVGLQRIDRYLDDVAVDAPETAGNRALLAFFIAGLASTDLERLQNALQVLPEGGDSISPAFDELAQWCAAIAPLAPTVDRHRRSSTVDDRLAYLVDGLSLVNRLHARAMATDTTATLVVSPMLARWNQLLVDALAAERARIAVTLAPVTRRVLPGRATELIVEVRNAGVRDVRQIRVTLEPSSQIACTLPAVEVGALPAGAGARLHFPVTVGAAGAFSVSFRLAVIDAAQQRAGFTTVLPFEAMGAARDYAPIPNPYVTGAPLRAESPLFVGRAEELALLRAALVKGSETPAVVLTGPKRMGKTSLLYRLPAVLGEGFAPVYLDMQGMGFAGGADNLLHEVAGEVAQALGLEAPPAAADAHDLDFFTHDFLPRVRAALGGRRLLLLLDEFEELEQRVQRGLLPGEFFGYLRHLMQHQPQLAWVFVGTQALADLPAAHWDGLFSGAIHRAVGLLDDANAARLIVEPVRGFLEYDDLAIDKILRLTAGHPYFVQVLCHAVIFDANRERRTVVTAHDVEAAVPRALEMSEAHLLALWRELPPAEQAAARAAAHNGAIPAVDGAGGHRFALELQRRWVAQQGDPGARP
ncbi:MAG: AAA family ATPase [Caldilineaceae bacterium]|nr:AAA family ATPase [Caldilineaceae bacterium]